MQYITNDCTGINKILIGCILDNVAAPKQFDLDGILAMFHAPQRAKPGRPDDSRLWFFLVHDLQLTTY